MKELVDSIAPVPQDAVTGSPVIRVSESFDTFYKREFRSMVSLAYATSKGWAVAEDVAQEALAAAFHDWDRVGRLDNPATWVRRVVINKSVGVVRRRMSGIRAQARLRSEPSHADFPTVSAETEHVWDAVRKLPRRQRQVVALRFIDQLTFEEIGDVLGCSKDTVNTHLRRAKSTLAHRLGSEETS
ncbi:MAG: SigE family RNA polymerase sigma factor [Armatimonadetes bacterium]|nr:MAG: SigE family RNA polymerase sigma factor [Armatimonadota bacterium]